METIRVNMTPCEDVQTIHASQNDNEAREWGFELHNNGEKIDSSSISDQLVFKAYEGGTEQILPENGAVPVTAPFVGDIKYPDATRNDQEFLYRESPTEEDGYAKIETIYGNTLKWNQLIQNGNFGNTGGWTPTSTTTFTVSDNVGSVTWNGTGTYARIQQGIPRYANHKYLAICDIKLSNANDNVTPISMYNGTETVDSVNADSVNWKTYFLLFTQLKDSDSTTSRTRFCQMLNASTAEIRNAMLFDLTAMGLDISNPSEFTSLFPLPYYAYNQGTLLSFMGNGIKTVGKNFFNGYLENTRTITGFYIREVNTSDQPAPIKFPKGTYTFSIKSNVQGRAQLELYSGGKTNDYIVINPLFTINVGTTTLAFTVEKDIDYIRMYGNFAGTLSDAQIEFGSATEYEPYTSSTLSLPISTYFTNGMDGIGNVFDEKTENKTIQRLVHYKVTGNENVYTWVDNTSTIYGNHYGGAIDIPSLRNCMYGGNMVAIASRGYQIKYANENKTIYLGNNGRLSIIDDSYTTRSAWLEGIKDLEVVFALRAENYVETSFTTASLVTENAEIPLSNNDGILIGKCTEELSAQPGFFDAKIKLTDGDGTCYSDKIQLHVERKPS